MTPRLRWLTLGLAITTALTSACASRVASGAGSSANRAPDRAATPRLAAIGYDHDATAISSSVLHFACMPDGTYTSISVGPRHGTVMTSTVRDGDRWIVTVSDASGLDASKYRVRHDHGGYCVDRDLGEAIPSDAPSSAN